ncbi:hypothetical protein Tco_1063215 [Tanacetum coccineum]
MLQSAASMTRRSNSRFFTPFTNPERQFRARRNTTPISVHNIFSFYESESTESESEKMAKVNIETLTMEQYLALAQGDQGPGIVRPEIENDDAHEHVEKVLEIVSLFNSLGVTNDAVMLRAFPLTLTGVAKRWIDMTAKQLEKIHNFKQEEGETLYHAWERYNDMLFMCPTHDLNNYQKVSIFYNGLDIPTRQILDSRGLIPGMTATRALKSIQDMADHSQKWHDEASDRRMGSCTPEGITTINNKLNDLRRDMRKLKESVHAIQFGCEICDGIHLDKDSPIKEEVKSIEATRSRESTDLSLKKHDATIRKLVVKVEQLAQEIHAYMTNRSKSVNQAKAVATKSSPIIHHSTCSRSFDSNIISVTFVLSYHVVHEKAKESNEDDKPPHSTHVIELPKEPGTFADKVKRRITEKQGKLFLESLEKLPVNIPLVDTRKQTPDYTKCLHELMSNKTKIKEVSMVKLNARCSVVLQNKLPPKQKDPRSFILPCLIGSVTFSNALADLGASISVMPFSMFKRLGLGNPKHVKLLIEMM